MVLPLQHEPKGPACQEGWGLLGFGSREPRKKRIKERIASRTGGDRDRLGEVAETTILKRPPHPCAARVWQRRLDQHLRVFARRGNRRTMGDDIDALLDDVEGLLGGANSPSREQRSPRYGASPKMSPAPSRKSGLQRDQREPLGPGAAQSSTSKWAKRKGALDLKETPQRPGDDSTLDDILGELEITLEDTPKRRLKPSRPVPLSGTQKGRDPVSRSEPAISTKSVLKLAEIDALLSSVTPSQKKAKSVLLMV